MDAPSSYPSPAPSTHLRSCQTPYPVMRSLEEDDSPLSSLQTTPQITPQTTPSPPPSPVAPSYSPFTPCSSQDSSRASQERDSSGPTSGAEDSDARPIKRRRLSPRMPRDTHRLDLNGLADPYQQAELDRLVKALKTKRKIVVVAGAGISVSAGIPDFRSSAGLFNSLKAQHNLKGSGKHLFDAAVYRDSASTSSFHEMVRSLSTLSNSATATPFHHLLARLAHEGRLLRLYSQNVDGIDTSLPPLATQVPLPLKGPWPKTVQLHGGLTNMVCTKCSKLFPFQPDLFDGPIPPECEQCQQNDYARTEVAGKRSHGVGKLRPRMVLYNEHNPDDEAIGAVAKADLRRRPDCIIVVGTTLKVPGVRRIVREMCSVVRDHRDGLSVWINNDPEPSSKEFEGCWDMIVKGTSDEIAKHAALRQWDEAAKDVKEVTEEEVALVKKQSQLKVVVQSPSKPYRFKVADEQLPTPIDSPRFGPRLENEDLVHQEGAAKMTLNASKGKTIKQVLNPKAQKPSTKRVAKKASATAKAPQKPRKQAPSKQEAAPGFSEWQIKKTSAPEPCKFKNETEAPKREPLTPSRTRENSQAAVPSWISNVKVEERPPKENVIGCRFNSEPA